MPSPLDKVLKPWAFATLEDDALGFNHIVEVVSYPTPAGTIMVRAIPDFPGTLLEVPARKLSLPFGKPVAVSTARVSGFGSFPIDMLRYDQAVPVSFKLDEANKPVLQDEWKELFVATVLIRGYSRREGGFTLARWASFGWSCIPHSIEPIGVKVA